MNTGIHHNEVVLVTGAAGFIGYHVCNYLIKQGELVLALDNINAYYDINLKYARLQELGIAQSKIKDNILVESEKLSGLSFIKLDIVDKHSLNLLFKEFNITKVIHLAAQAGVRYSIDHPEAYVESNLVGFINVLEACRYNNIKHLMYASSSSVYGNNMKVPFSENDRVDHPISLYAATKKSNELMAHSYSHLFQLPTTALRFFTVYGPWGRPDMAPIKFAQLIAKGKTIDVYNNGDLERDFTYIDDIVEGIIRLLDHAPGEKDSIPFYRILNIGNSKPIRLMDFIANLEKELGIEALKNMCSMQPGDVKITYADTNLLEHTVAYKPKINLNQGIMAFVRWFKSYYQQS